jgi:hypothetical protein
MEGSPGTREDAQMIVIHPALLHEARHSPTGLHDQKRPAADPREVDQHELLPWPAGN